MMRLFTAVILFVCLTLQVRAAISEGDLVTDPVLAKKKLQDDYYRAEKSNQERLQAARARGLVKDQMRARLVAAMNSQLRARAQQVVVPNTPAAPTSAVQEVATRSFAGWMVGLLLLAGVWYIFRVLRRATVSRGSLEPPLA